MYFNIKPSSFSHEIYFLLFDVMRRKYEGWLLISEEWLDILKISFRIVKAPVVNDTAFGAPIKPINDGVILRKSSFVLFRL